MSILAEKWPGQFSRGSFEVSPGTELPDHVSEKGLSKKVLRIALIGPSYPYRGGIAHHTNMLSIYLRRRGHEVDLITFTRQYPKFLYPGKFQEEPGEGGGFADSVVSQRMIDAINPFNWIQVGRELRRRKYDLYVFKFWLPFFGPAFGTIARLVRERGRNNVLVVCENVLPHEPHLGDLALTRYFFNASDLAITQSGSVQEDLRRLFPRIPQIMLPHPTYENFGPSLSKSAARARLGIKATKVILFFGFIRQYKGLDRLLAALPEIVRLVPDIHLFVVGEFLEASEKYLRVIADKNLLAHLTVLDQYVPNEEVAWWFSAADMVVLPYRSATNSGIVQIAYNFATPVIVTDVGSLGEIVSDGKTGSLLKDASPTTIAQAIQKMYQNGNLEQISRAIKAERGKFSWEGFVKGMEDLVFKFQSRE